MDGVCLFPNMKCTVLDMLAKKIYACVIFLFTERRAKLMERLLKQRSHYHLVRKYLHRLNLSQLHQKEMLLNLIMLVLTLKKMGPGAQERVCLCFIFWLFVTDVVYSLCCVIYYHQYVLSISSTENRTFSEKAITST